MQARKRQQRPAGRAKGPATGGEPSDGIFAPSSVAQRIQAAAHGAIGCLPRTLRDRAVHLWNAANLQRLTEAMGLWIRGADLEAEQFAHLFFGREADDPGVSQLHDAALNVGSATDHTELSGGAHKIAAALQVIGLDRWPGFLAEVRARATDPATVAAVDHNHEPMPKSASPGEPTSLDVVNPQPTDAATAPPETSHKILPVTGRPEQLPLPGQAGAGTYAHAWALPPPGIRPPVRNPNGLSPRSASRPSASANGGQSLWDENGGEWRFYPADTWNRSSWDYNEHAGPNSPWRTVPANNPDT